MKTNWKDLGERTVRTFLQTAIGSVLASTAGVLDAAVWQSASVAGFVAVLTVVHGWLQPADGSGIV